MNRILVLTKFRYLGDTIVATPFLRRLREAYPETQVTLLTGPALPVLLQGCPYVDEIWPFDTDAPQKLKRNIDLVARIRAENFDAAFLLNRSLHSGAMVAGARVPCRVGFSTEHRRPLLTIPVTYSRSKPEIECYLDLLKATGAKAEPALPELWVTTEERSRAREFVATAAGAEARRLIVLQPGSKDPQRKQWPVERFAVVADELQRRLAGRNLAIVLMGAKEEQEDCARVASLTGFPAIDLSGKTSLREALGLLAEADLLIANDSAMVHAAVAVGAPTVAIHGPQTAAKWGYHCGMHRVVKADDYRGPVNKAGNRQALDLIPPEAVIEAALSVLSIQEETHESGCAHA